MGLEIRDSLTRKIRPPQAAFPHAFVTNTLMKMRCKSVVTKGGGRLFRTIGEVHHHTVIIIQSIASARIASCKCTRLTWRLGLFPASTAPHTHGWGGGGGRDRDALWTVTTTGRCWLLYMCSHTCVDHAAAPTSLIFAGRCRFGVSQAYQRKGCWQCRRVVCRQSLRVFEGDIMGALTMSPALSTSALRGRWLLRQHAFGAAGGLCAAVTASVLQPQLRGCRRSSSLRQRLCHCGVGTTADSGQLQTAAASVQQL